MSRLECDSCGDLVDVSWRTTTLPYICQRCTKDSALAIEQDVWETEYVGPACQQAAEEVHGLYIEAGDNIPCDDATTYYIVEARSKSSTRVDDWFRSENDNTKGVFDDYSTALEAAEREQDGSRIEYRVVEYRPEPTPCDAPYNSGVPCQSALDSVQEEQYLDPVKHEIDDFLTTGYRAAHDSDILDQFNADTELINDLREQLDEAHASNASLTEEIEFCDKRVRAYQQVATEADNLSMENEKEIRRLKELLDKNSQGIHLLHLELSDENASLRSMLKDKTCEAKTYELAYERVSRSLWERITDWFE